MKVGGGWTDQWAVLRSSNMKNILMDAEEQLKVKWKGHWRKAITGIDEIWSSFHVLLQF